MGMTFAEAKQAVIDILSKPPIHQLNFMCGMHVTPALFEDVKNAIQTRKISVIVAPAGNLDDADAEYFPDKNAMVLADTVSKKDCYGSLQTKSLIVHETVHAIADMKKLAITQMSSEAAGHMAAALYRVLSAQPIPSSLSSYNNDEAKAKIWSYCDTLIDKYSLRYKFNVVSTDDLNELRNLIHKHGQYADIDLRKMQVADGI